MDGCCQLRRSDRLVNHSIDPERRRGCPQVTADKSRDKCGRETRVDLPDLADQLYPRDSGHARVTNEQGILPRIGAHGSDRGLRVGECRHAVPHALEREAAHGNERDLIIDVEDVFAVAPRILLFLPSRLLRASENGVVVFASSTGQEESLEKESWGNGAFTKALLEGLSGRADFMRAGRITYAALNLFVSEEVSRLTDGRQRPVFISPRGVPDFALARL